MPFVTFEDRGPIRRLTMSAPGRKNAIPPGGWEELAEAFESFSASSQRVLVVRGDGGDFCAGADLGRDAGDVASAAANAERMRAPNAAAQALFRLSKPTIAAVDGVAVGAGMNLALGCDIVVATDRARFAEIFVKRGLTVDFGGTWLLPRLVGLARARELALTGRMVGAEEAFALGMIGPVVAPEDLEDAVASIAAELAAGAPLAQRFIKAGLARATTLSFEQALAWEAQAQAVLLGSEDVREGAAAFLEKRDPRFEGH